MCQALQYLEWLQCRLAKIMTTVEMLAVHQGILVATDH
jgi:hypothetical protein